MSNRHRSQRVLVAIGVYKLVEAALLVLLGLAALRLFHGDVEATITRWVRELRIDPGRHFVHLALARVTHLTPRRVKEIELGTFFYAALFAVEGIGLVLRKRWGEYVAVVTTGAFLPLEVHELVRHFRWTTLAVLVINLLILAYIIVELWKTRRGAGDEGPHANAI